MSTTPSAPAIIVTSPRGQPAACPPHPTKTGAAEARPTPTIAHRISGNVEKPVHDRCEPPQMNPSPAIRVGVSASEYHGRNRRLTPSATDATTPTSSQGPSLGGSMPLRAGGGLTAT